MQISIKNFNIKKLAQPKILKKLEQPKILKSNIPNKW